MSVAHDADASRAPSRRRSPAILGAVDTGKTGSGAQHLGGSVRRVGSGQGRRNDAGDHRGCAHPCCAPFAVCWPVTPVGVPGRVTPRAGRCHANKRLIARERYLALRSGFGGHFRRVAATENGQHGRPIERQFPLSHTGNPHQTRIITRRRLGDRRQRRIGERRMPARSPPSRPPHATP